MKEIPGFPRYRITTDGKIYRADGKERRVFLHKNGYLKLMINGKNLTVHRLVALTYIPRKEGKNYVCHKNNIKTDNRVENLYWGTQKENIAQAIREGRLKLSGSDNPMFGKVGELNPNTKLTNMDVKQIIKEVKNGNSISIIAQKYKVSYGQVRHLYKKYINNQLNF